MFEGELPNGPIEGFPDALAAERFVDAQVVDVKGSDILEDVVPAGLPEHAEGVSHQPVVVVHGGEHRSLFVVQDPDELLPGVFSRPGPEEVGTPPVVDHAYLVEQFVDSVDILFLSLADFHGEKF